ASRSAWLASGACEHLVPEGIGEDQDQRDDEAIDRCRLDHRKSHEQRARNRARGVGLLSNRGEGLSHGARFAERRTDGADGHGERRREDRVQADDGYASHWVLLFVAFGLAAL